MIITQKYQALLVHEKTQVSYILTKKPVKYILLMIELADGEQQFKKLPKV